MIVTSRAATLDMVSFDTAQSIVDNAITTLGSEWVPLSDALGRVAAESVIAEEDLVPYARSAMDGYAVRACDTASAGSHSPVRIPVAGKLFTGDGQTALAPGVALAITTGAPLPTNADAVVPYEQVEFREGTLVLRQAIPAGDCVFPPAEDVRRGETLLERGSVLRPATLGLLAFAGKSGAQVFQRPRVHVLCTGNELVNPWETPSVGQVRNSNAYSLVALLTECGAEAQYCGAVVDKSEALSSSFKAAREDADMLLTTGGASVGERDLVKSVLEALGVDFEFRRVAMRPGKPFAFGMWGTLPVCVLPGNPAAAFVCFGARSSCCTWDGWPHENRASYGESSAYRKGKIQGWFPLCCPCASSDRGCRVRCGTFGKSMFRASTKPRHGKWLHPSSGGPGDI